MELPGLNDSDAFVLARLSAFETGAALLNLVTSPVLNGFTQAAASPMMAQLVPAIRETAPPIGSSADATERNSPPRSHSPRRWWV